MSKTNTYILAVTVPVLALALLSITLQIDHLWAADAPSAQVRTPFCSLGTAPASKAAAPASQAKPACCALKTPCSLQCPSAQKPCTKAQGNLLAALTALDAADKALNTHDHDTAAAELQKAREAVKAAQDAFTSPGPPTPSAP